MRDIMTEHKIKVAYKKAMITKAPKIEIRLYHGNVKVVFARDGYFKTTIYQKQTFLDTVRWGYVTLKANTIFENGVQRLKTPSEVADWVLEKTRTL